MVPDPLKFSMFVFATAVFTFTIFSSPREKQRHKGPKIFGWLLTVILAVVCMATGVTAEELLLVCIPPSIGIGILSSYVLEWITKGSIQHDEEHLEIHLEAQLCGHRL